MMRHCLCVDALGPLMPSGLVPSRDFWPITHRAPQVEAILHSPMPKNLNRLLKAPLRPWAWPTLDRIPHRLFAAVPRWK